MSPYRDPTLPKPPPPKPVPSTVWRCPYCMQRNYAHMVYCIKCGKHRDKDKPFTWDSR